MSRVGQASLTIAELVVHPARSSRSESQGPLVEFAVFGAAGAPLLARDLRWNEEHHRAKDRSVTLAVLATWEHAGDFVALTEQASSMESDEGIHSQAFD